MSNVTRFGPSPLLDKEVANKEYVDSASGEGIDLTTKGDLHGFDTVDKRIAIGTNNQVLTADSALALGIKWADPAGGGLTFAKVVKSTDEIVNNSSTLQDDDELLFTPSINKVYHGRLVIFNDGGSTPDIKFAFTIPTGATIEWGGLNSLFRVANALSADGTTAITAASQNATAFWWQEFVLVMSSTSGAVTLQWAQALATSSDTTVKAGSYLVVYEE